MKIYCMLAYRAWDTPSPVLRDTLQLLRQRGFEVQLGIAAQTCFDLSQFPLNCDLYLLKSRAPFWWSLAALAHQQGRRVLNPFPASVLARDKVAATAALQAAGVPVPRSWVTGDPHWLEELLARQPLILKPGWGEQGRGLTIVHQPAGLPARLDPAQPWLVQEYVAHAPDDIKVYAIGETLCAFRKPFAPDSYQRVGEPFTLSSDLEALVRRCGQALNLSLYGVDLIETAAGPLVVDVNVFPAYRQFHQAPAVLAEHIALKAREP